MASPSDGRAHFGVVAFGIEDANLKAAFGHALEERRRQRRLAAARQAGDERAAAVRTDEIGRRPCPRDLDEAALPDRGEGVDVVFEEAVDEFGHAGAAARPGDEVGPSLIAGSALATATAQPAACMKAWSFSASPTPTTLCADRPSSSSAASSPVALFTPAGRTITAPLLKTICSSSPRSRIAVERDASFGSQVATIKRPTDSGVTPVFAAARRSLRRRSGASGRSSLVAGPYSSAPFSATTRSNRSRRETRLQVGQLAAGDQDQLAAGPLEPSSASMVRSTTPSCARVPS